jgi:hypothetical protein
VPCNRLNSLRPFPRRAAQLPLVCHLSLHMHRALRLGMRTLHTAAVTRRTGQQLGCCHRQLPRLGHRRLLLLHCHVVGGRPLNAILPPMPSSLALPCCIIS